MHILLGIFWASVLPALICKDGRLNADQALVRCDGMYRSQITATGTTDYWHYVRFFRDGTVITVSSVDGPEKIAPWFTKKCPKVAAGEYRIVGKEVTFTAISKEGMVDYVGSVESGQLRTRASSRINGNVSDTFYQFVPLDESKGAKVKGK